MRLLSTPPALILTAALTALLVGAGGAVAGSLVTSAQIEDGTIRSVDVADRTLNLRDLKPGARLRLQGQDGEAGADGAAGPAGEAGAPGAPGPVGPVGATGARGSAGPSGVDGVLGYVVAYGASQPATEVDLSFSATAEALCPDTTIAVSGGYYFYGDNGANPAGVSATWSMAQSRAAGWTVRSVGPVAHSVQAIAYCVTGERPAGCGRVAAPGVTARGCREAASPAER